MTASSQELGRISRDHVVNKIENIGYKILDIKNMEIKAEGPEGSVLFLRVTSLSRRNAWIIPVSEYQSCYYALVLREGIEPRTVFILSPDEMKKEISYHLSKMKRPVTQYSNPELEKKGLGFTQPFPYENKWATLPK